MDAEAIPSAAVPLESIIVTSQLVQRPCRSSNLQEENDAFHDLAGFLASEPDTFLDRLVEMGVRLCKADTVGISVEETNLTGEQIFRWVAIAGKLRQMVGGTTPRNFSPCGVCMDTNAPLLMDDLDRFYPYFKEAPLPFSEALLVPWTVKDGAKGTLWIVAHSHQRKFDLQDLRLMSSLAAFASGGIYLRQIVREAERLAAAAKMIAEMAHHINNPLQGALLALYQLKARCDIGPGTRELLLGLEEDIKRIATLSSELLRGEGALNDAVKEHMGKLMA